MHLPIQDKLLLVPRQCFIRDKNLKYAVIVEKDETGYYVGSVPELPGCHTQAKTIDELIKRIKEAIELYLECEENQPKEHIDIVGLLFVEVSAE
jgi:predicted RNase H-like HicB family nuclease